MVAKSIKNDFNPKEWSGKYKITGMNPDLRMYAHKMVNEQEILNEIWSVIGANITLPAAPQIPEGKMALFLFVNGTEDADLYKFMYANEQDGHGNTYIEYAISKPPSKTEDVYQHFYMTFVNDNDSVIFQRALHPQIVDRAMQSILGNAPDADEDKLVAEAGRWLLRRFSFAVIDEEHTDGLAAVITPTGMPAEEFSGVSAALQPLLKGWEFVDDCGMSYWKFPDKANNSLQYLELACALAQKGLQWDPEMQAEMAPQFAGCIHRNIPVKAILKKPPQP